MDGRSSCKHGRKRSLVYSVITIRAVRAVRRSCQRSEGNRVLISAITRWNTSSLDINRQYIGENPNYEWKWIKWNNITKLIIGIRFITWNRRIHSFKIIIVSSRNHGVEYVYSIMKWTNCNTKNYTYLFSKFELTESSKASAEIQGTSDSSFPSKSEHSFIQLKIISNNGSE